MWLGGRWACSDVVIDVVVGGCGCGWVVVGLVVVW